MATKEQWNKAISEVNEHAQNKLKETDAANNEEKIFSINDVVDFLQWAYEHYRVEGVIGSGIYETTELVEEYVKTKLNGNPT